MLEIRMASWKSRFTTVKQPLGPCVFFFCAFQDVRWAGYTDLSRKTWCKIWGRQHGPVFWGPWLMKQVHITLKPCLICKAVHGISWNISLYYHTTSSFVCSCSSLMVARPKVVFSVLLALIPKSHPSTIEQPHSMLPNMWSFIPH